MTRDEEQPDHGEDPRGRDVGSGYPEEQPGGANPGEPNPAVEHGGHEGGEAAPGTAGEPDDKPDPPRD